MASPSTPMASSSRRSRSRPAGRRRGWEPSSAACCSSPGSAASWREGCWTASASSPCSRSRRRSARARSCWPHHGPNSWPSPSATPWAVDSSARSASTTSPRPPLRAEVRWRGAVRFEAAIVAVAFVVAQLLVGGHRVRPAGEPRETALHALRLALRDRRMRRWLAAALIAGAAGSCVPMVWRATCSGKAPDRARLKAFTAAG